MLIWVAVGGTGVLLGMGVEVGGFSVSVGTKVDDDGTSVSVGDGGIGVALAGIVVGGASVAVGGMGVLLAGMFVGSGVWLTISTLCARLVDSVGTGGVSEFCELRIMPMPKIAIMTTARIVIGRRLLLSGDDSLLSALA